MHAFGRLSRLALTAVAAALPLAAAAADEQVNFYNWANYIADDTLPNFTKQTGIKVIYDVFDTNELLETKLLAGSTGYDVVVPGSDFMARQIKAGAFMELDKSKIPNYAKLDPVIMKRLAEFDPENRYGIPYMWGTTGIGYNIDKLQEIFGKDLKIDSWEFVFNPENMKKLESCGIAVLDNPTEIYATVLNYLGKDPNKATADDFSGVATDTMMKIRPYIRYFHSSKFITDLANGDICLAIAWSGDILQARDRAQEAKNNVNVGYTIPKEGALMWLDIMTIPKDAKHADAAHKLINYLLDPKVMAANSDAVSYANAVAESWPLIKPEVRNHEGIFPPPEVAAKLFVLKPLDQKTSRVVTRSWTRVRSGR